MTTRTEDTAKAYQKTTFDNGLRLVTCEMPQTRSVSINIFIGVGSRYEPSEQAGISHFIEHLVFKGTNRRPTPWEISATIEGAGGSLNAGTEQELTVYWCKVPQRHYKESLDLLIDMLRNSLLEPEGIEKERMVVIEELNMINDHPSYKVDALIDEMLWPNHPLGRDIGGTKESVSTMTREMVQKHMALNYTPSNIVVSVAGNVSHLETIRQLEVLCKGWSSSQSLRWIPFTHLQSAPQCQIKYRKTEQTHLSIAVLGAPLEHPDRYAMDLLSVILGEGMSSRLFVEVRERRGLAYDIHSSTSHFLDSGALAISAGVDHKRIYDAVRTILTELSGLRVDVPEEELERAKSLSTGRLLLRMEDTQVVSAWMGSQELLLKRILDVDEVVNKISNVTSKEVCEVAKEMLVTKHLNMAVVGRIRNQNRLERLLRL